MHLIFRAQARPSKKAKLNKTVDDSNPPNLEQNPEQSNRNTKAILDDPPPQDHETLVEHMEVDPMIHADKPPSPTKAADENTDDVMVTGVSYTAPGNPTALSKHSAKEEFSAIDKGKWKVDLESYAHLSAQDNHSGFLNCLHSSRDCEAGLLNMMKERYEVNVVNSA